MKTILNPDSRSDNRRKFLKQLSAGALATIALPSLAGQFDAMSSGQSLPGPPNPSDEQYWEMVKKQFTVPPNLIMMNAANLCPSPFSVNERVQALARSLNSDVSFQYRSVFSGLRAKAIDQLAQFAGASQEEIGITRNTSEANCIIVNGLDFKTGDEIIIWDQNHPSNGIAWEKRAKRSGLTVKKVTVPAWPKNIDELVAPFEKAATAKTRLIAFSHASNLSGLTLPAREICAMATARGILTLIDGAQTLGMMDLDLKNLGCDFFSASTHKWMMGPMENGVLYAGKNHLDKIWPGVLGGGWKEESKTLDEKLCVLGQRNETTTSALPETIAFNLTMGKKVIEERVVHLNNYLKDQIQTRIPKAVFVTPLEARFSAGIVIVSFPGKDMKVIYEKLYSDYGIACSSTGGIRLSPHIYNTVADLDKVVNALAELSRA